MKTLRRWIFAAGLAALVATALPTGATAATDDFNDGYVYASTRAVSEMDADPGLQITLYPMTLVVDTAFLPFAVITGFVT